MYTNGHISFLAKKEAHTPENARGNSDKSMEWIPRDYLA
jgi:hypothetical protein